MLSWTDQDHSDCRVHRAGGVDDAGSAKAVQDVVDFGFHIVVVSNSEADCHPDPTTPVDEPEFGYTVGLWHSRGHAELLISGLPVQLMGQMLSDCGQRVLAGQSLWPGSMWEDVLAGVGVTAEDVDDGAAERHATFAQWFHRGAVPVRQVVWPDTGGYYAWQLPNPGRLAELQPEGWRLAGPRAGLLATEPELPATMPAASLAYVCKHVTHDRDPVLYVQRDDEPERGDEWVFTCSGSNHETSDVTLQHLVHVAMRAPGIIQLADLPTNAWAERETPTSPWVWHS